MLHFTLYMPYLTILAANVAILAPVIIAAIKPGRRMRWWILSLYAVGILWITVGERSVGLLTGSRPPYAVPQLNLTPFWSYAKFDQADMRWQVYMNVFLFIPFGFMLPWCSERFQKLWKVLLISAAFSVLTEIVQYVLRIGLCETDDVIHNTLGGALGYGYWRLLNRIQARFRGENK